MPPRVCELGVGGFCPSLKLVDTYPMAKSGRYPVTGYDNNGNPVIDEQSGYTNTGFTENFKQLLQERKLQQAAYLLSQSSLSVEQIMEAIGYSNSSYFYNSFKVKYNDTPRDYRKNAA